jgi:hypothetical protein
VSGVRQHDGRARRQSAKGILITGTAARSQEGSPMPMVHELVMALAAGGCNWEAGPCRTTSGFA